MRRLSMFGGLFLAGCGAFLIWMLYGFGTMMDQDIQGTAPEGTIWRSVTSNGTFPFGLLLIAVGGWLMFHKPKRNPQGGSR